MCIRIQAWRPVWNSYETDLGKKIDVLARRTPTAPSETASGEVKSAPVHRVGILAKQSPARGAQSAGTSSESLARSSGRHSRIVDVHPTPTPTDLSIHLAFASVGHQSSAIASELRDKVPIEFRRSQTPNGIAFSGARLFARPLRRGVRQHFRPAHLVSNRSRRSPARICLCHPLIWCSRPMRGTVR